MRPEKIIVHHSLTSDGPTVSWGAIRKFHMTDPKYMFKEIGYHAGVELVGDYYEVLLGRQWNEVGAHTTGQNYNSLGICFIGNFDNAAPPEKQLLTGAKVIRYWMEIFGIPESNIFPHSKFSMKTCPGRMFDMMRLRELIRS